MNADPVATSNTPKRPRRSAGPLPPPPAGVPVLNRIEAAAFMGVSLGAFGVWERDGRVTIPRYRAVAGSGLAIFYAADDLARLREEFRRLEEPYPDPERPGQAGEAGGVYRVPIRSRLHRMEALIDAADLPKVQGKRWNVRVGTDDGKIEVILSTVSERTVPLKRIIMGVEGAECKEQVVGHVNGDPLDCRRVNLVLKTRSDVSRGSAKMMVRAGRAASSTYKGVLWDADRRLWKAQIGTREHHRQLGRFRDEAEAAAAYDHAARAMFGAAAAPWTSGSFGSRGWTTIGWTAWWAAPSARPCRGQFCSAPIRRGRSGPGSGCPI